MHLITKDVGFFDANKTGDILSRIAADIQVVQSGLGTNISMFTRSFVFVVVTIIILVYISWQLTLVTLGGIIPIILFAIVFAINVRKLTKEQQARNAECGNVSEEAISNIRTVKAFACEDEEIAKFKAKNIEVYNIGKKVAIWYAFFSFVVQFAIYGAMAGIIYYGSILY